MVSPNGSFFSLVSTAHNLSLLFPFVVGGHLEHMMSWFAVRQECPTGCGHVCNMRQTLNAFPRSTSMREMNQLDSSSNS